MTRTVTVRNAIAYFVLSLTMMSLGVWACSEKFGHPAPGIDDAYIYFVYGQNIANGEGVVYNSEGERVEGFTSDLWMIVVALAFFVSEQPASPLLFLSILMMAGAIAYLWFYISKGKLLSWRSFLFLAWVFASPGFVAWTTLPLMDVTLWSAVLIIATVTVAEAKSSRRLGVLIALIVLARPEGMLWGIVFLVLFGLGFIAKAGLRSAYKSLRLPSLIYVVTLTSLIAVRLLYFGYPLPNTYYAKVSPDVTYNLTQGGLYLVNFIASNKFALVLVIGTAIAGIVFNLPRFLRRLRAAPFGTEDGARTETLVVSLIAMTGLIVPVLSGGDHFSMYRFYQPVWPILILPILAMLEAVRRPSPWVLRIGALLAALLVLILTPWYRWDNLSNSWLRVEFAVATRGAVLGDTFNSMFAGDPPSVGYGGAGTFAFVYDGFVVDIYGLNNVAMAHSSGDRRGIKNHAAFNTDVLLDQQPALFYPKICSRNALARTTGPIEYKDDAALNGIFQDQRFLDSYVLSSVVDTQDCILAWIRKDYAVELMDRGYSIEEMDYHLVLDE